MMAGLVEATTKMLRGMPRGNTWLETKLNGLRIRRVSDHKSYECQLAGPLCGLIIQGAKEVVIDDRRITFSAGDAMVVSEHVPAISRIIEGSEARPYIAAIMPFDLSLLISLWHEISEDMPKSETRHAVEAIAAPSEIVDAFTRLLTLASCPIETRVLAPLIVRELHLRFLMGPQGAVLRSRLATDSKANRIGRTIAHIRQHGDQPISIPVLSRIAGMGTSSFHTHFKAVTGMTPLSFQKEIRLSRAQNLLLDPTQTVASVAFAVGYESANQFSRDYSRRFGRSPRAYRDSTVSNVA